MTAYARLDPITGTVSAIVDLTPEAFAALAGNPKRAYLLPFSIDAQPTPSATQVVVEGGYVIEAAQVRKTWGLRNKTQAELDLDTATAEKAIAKQALAVLDARSATNAQVQRILAWLIRQQG